MPRFFSDDSFWNQPIEPAAAVDPDSDRYVELMRPYDKALHINMSKFTIPVYEVDASTPRHTVHQLLPDPDQVVDSDPERRARQIERAMRFSQHPDFGKDVPIPDHAVPDPDTDAHMAMVDWERKIAWDMWYCVKRDDGSWASYTGMTYPLDGSGVWSPDDFAVKKGESIHFYGPSRAAGVPAIAGLIMREEIEAGRIEHRIAFACWSNAIHRFQPPATWTDGFRPEGMPEGCVLQLDPELDLDRFPLTPGGRTVARALQEYGMVNTDCARGNVVYAEGLYGDPDRSWDGLLGEDDLRCIPIEHYRVLKLEGVIEGGDHDQPRAYGEER